MGLRAIRLRPGQSRPLTTIRNDSSAWKPEGGTKSVFSASPDPGAHLFGVIPRSDVAAQSPGSCHGRICVMG